MIKTKKSRKIRKRSAISEPSLAGRPKGRNFVTISISITAEQALWLGRERNASEVIRELLDSVISGETLNPEYVKSVELRKKREHLQKRLQDLNSEIGPIMKGKEHLFKGEYNEETKEYVLARDKDFISPIPAREGDLEAQKTILALQIVWKQHDDTLKQIKAVDAEFLKLGQTGETTKTSSP